MHSDKHAARSELHVTPALGMRNVKATKSGACARPLAYQALRRPALQPGHFVNLTI